jgi:hypothetical protein
MWNNNGLRFDLRPNCRPMQLCTHLDRCGDKLRIHYFTWGAHAKNSWQSFPVSEVTKACPRVATGGGNPTLQNIKYSLDVRVPPSETLRSDRLSLKLMPVNIWYDMIGLILTVVNEAARITRILRASTDWTDESECAFLPAGEQILSSQPNKRSANQVYWIYYEPYEEVVVRCHRLVSLVRIILDLSTRNLTLLHFFFLF